MPPMTDDEFANMAATIFVDRMIRKPARPFITYLPGGHAFASAPAIELLPPWPPISRIRYWPEGAPGFVSNRQAQIWMMDPEVYRR